MQSAKFIALTGHLNEYPLADLVGLLRRQRKTGRLLIEYTIGPCSLYFAEGHLVDAQLNSMCGMQAILIALSQPNASFNFNPLIPPPRRSISESSQRVVLELMGSPAEKSIGHEGAPESRSAIVPAPAPRRESAAEIDEAALPPARKVLALPASPLERVNRRRNRRVLIASAVISLLVSLVTVVAFTRWLVRRDINAALAEAGRKNEQTESRSAAGSATAQTIKVTVRFEQGRVTHAAVEERRPGMEAYEVLALRIARSRRYASSAAGQETVSIKINAPDQ